MEELGHRNIIFGKVLRDCDILFSLFEEFSHGNIILSKELCHGDVILDLIEEVGNRAVEEMSQTLIMSRGQILKNVLHVAFAIESV